MADPQARDYRDLDTRMKSADALLAIGAEPAKVAEALVPWLADDEWDLRMAARRMLIAMGEPAALPVAANLSSADQMVMGAAAGVLSSMGPAARPAIPEIVAALIATGDPDGTLEMILSEIGPGDSEAVATLAAALDADNETVQARAASILGDWGPASAAALPALRRLAASDSSANYIAGIAIDDIEGGGES